VGTVTETLRGYEIRRVSVPAEEAEAELKARLDERLAALEGEVLYKEYETQLRGGLAVVTVRAELVQNIGVERRRDQ
jgi:hypothetical protein